MARLRLRLDDGAMGGCEGCKETSVLNPAKTVPDNDSGHDKGSASLEGGVR